LAIEILLRDGTFILLPCSFCLITQSIVNLVIVGSFVVLTFQKSIQTIQESFGFNGPASNESQQSDTD